MRASLAPLALATALLGCPQDVTPLVDATVDAGLVGSGDGGLVGETAVAGSLPFISEYNLVDAVTTESQTPPFSGTFLRGAAGFVDAAAGDFRLTPASVGIDVVSGAPSTVDFAGCPRPAPYRGASLSDIGAFEAQP